MIYQYEIVRYTSTYAKAMTWEKIAKVWKSIEADGVYALLDKGVVMKTKVIQNGIVKGEKE